MKKINIINGKRKIKIEVNKAGFFGKIFGLMFKSRNTSNLLFEFARQGRHEFHSFFVFFPFLIVWLNDKNNVLGSRIVRPFELSVVPEFSFKKALEVPINSKNPAILRFFVGKQGKV